jgi:hypothetical protein
MPQQPGDKLGWCEILVPIGPGGMGEVCRAKDTTYLTASNYEAKLDVYKRRDVTDPQPTLVFVQGGKRVQGSMEQSLTDLVPWAVFCSLIVMSSLSLGDCMTSPSLGKGHLMETLGFCSQQFVSDPALTLSRCSTYSPC